MGSLAARGDAVLCCLAFSGVLVFEKGQDNPGRREREPKQGCSASLDGGSLGYGECSIMMGWGPSKQSVDDFLVWAWP